MPGSVWTVLIVDDDHAVRERLSEVLHLEGYSVLTAVNGARALDILRVVPGRCLILLDLDMPVMGGEEFLLQLAALPMAATRLPVLVISGDPDCARVKRMPGVMDCLAKPVSTEVLLDAVRAHARDIGSA